jgi:hypothetical protein
VTGVGGWFACGAPLLLCRRRLSHDIIEAVQQSIVESDIEVHLIDATDGHGS